MVLVKWGTSFVYTLGIYMLINRTGGFTVLGILVRDLTLDVNATQEPVPKESQERCPTTLRVRQTLLESS